MNESNPNTHVLFNETACMGLTPTHYYGCPCHENRRNAEIEKLQERIAVLKRGIKAALDYSGNRWDEWGSRAEECKRLLVVTLEWIDNNES